MKKIIIPSPVSLKSPNGEPILDAKDSQITVTFHDFVTNTLLSDPKFGKTMADIFSAVEIKNKVGKATDEVELENADFERLLSVANEPSAGYNPVVVMQLISFFQAIKEAK